MSMYEHMSVRGGSMVQATRKLTQCHYEWLLACLAAWARMDEQRRAGKKERDRTVVYVLTKAAAAET